VRVYFYSSVCHKLKTRLHNKYTSV